jgi:hypothetical protein
MAMECEFLVRETLALTDRLRDSEVYQQLEAEGLCQEIWEDSFFHPDRFKEQAEEQPVLTSAPLPSSPGLVYRIEQTHSTFCLRGIAVPNLAQGLEKLLQEKNNEPGPLRVPVRSRNDVFFFVTKNLAQAELIVENLTNKRFSTEQDLIGQLTDRDFNWWLEEDGDTRLTVYFATHPPVARKKLIKLGPLGDPQVASVRFQRLPILMPALLPLDSLECNRQMVKVSCQDPGSPLFANFKKIFLEGENYFDAALFHSRAEFKTFYYYFDEIAVVRRFWLAANQYIHSHQD